MSRTCDTKDGYGWLSIALHWLSALIVLTLWVIGNSIRSAGMMHSDALQLHTSIAVTAWLLLWWRLLRRFRAGHPGPSRAQATRLFGVGRAVHYAMLVALAVMLVSGPLMVWSRGGAIHVFQLSMDAPFAAQPWLAEAMYFAHSWCAFMLMLGMALHIAGVFVHVVFHRDGTLDRMMIAAKRTQQRTMQRGSTAPPSTVRTT
jgi:cytochrome b561